VSSRFAASDSAAAATFFLLFDEGPGVGLGHRRRVESLGSELIDRGHDCVFVGLGATSIGTIAADAVVIDSYRTRADDAVFARARVVCALDDLGRDLDVDLVVDPSPGAIGAAHRRARRVLAGAAYALVPTPPEGTVPASVDVPVTRVLVTTGAADADGVGARIAGALAAAGLDAGGHEVEIRLVVGPWGATDVPRGVVPVRAPDGLGAELAAASLVVTAGGVALLEACLLGRPIVALALADNQRQAVCGLEREGAVTVATPETVVDAARALVCDRTRRVTLSVMARSAVDGKGAARVADVLEQLVLR
jgi:spore coat polysaccharide biosynthesis predicted glycosyltransferase SpsG